MKGFIGSKLVLKLATLVVLIGAIVISLAGPITHSHAASASSQASWNIVPSPNSNQFGINSINSIAHVSANDIWAVGDSIDQSNRNNSQPLIEHWDGTSWSIVASPNPNTINVLNGITAISSNDIWAVGYTNPGSNTQTLTEHWDGTSWS